MQGINSVKGIRHLPDSLIFIRLYVGMIALFYRKISQSTNEKGSPQQRGLPAKRSDAGWGIEMLIILQEV